MIRLDSGEDDEAENKLKPPPKPPVFDPTIAKFYESLTTANYDTRHH